MTEEMPHYLADVIWDHQVGTPPTPIDVSMMHTPPEGALETPGVPCVPPSAFYCQFLLVLAQMVLFLVSHSH